MIRDLVHTITGYPGLFVFCASSGILYPLPEDFSLIYAGVRIASGEWGWGPTVLVALVAVLVRDLAAFGLGWWLGRWLLYAGWVRRLVGEKKLEWAEDLVRNNGPSAILVGRFLIGFRAPIFMVAGATRLPLRSFVGWDVAGLIVAVPAVIVLGFAFGDPLADTFFWIMARAREGVAVGVLLTLVLVWWRMRATAPAQEG